MDGVVERASEPKTLEGEGLREAMRCSYAMVRRSARRILRDDDAAQDVAQEVFLRAMGKEKIDGFAAPPAWLHRVTVNLCLNRLRDERRRQELLVGYASEGWRQAPPEAALLLSEILQEIPNDLECAVLRHYVEDESHQEIATLMGVSRRTVGNRIASFQQWLTARSAEPAPGDGRR